MFKRRIYPLLLCFAAALLILSSVASADDTAKSDDEALHDSLNKICDALGPKETYLNKQLSEKPDDISLRLQLADLLLDKSRISEAEVQYDKILAADKNNILGLMGLAACYQREGKTRMALDRCATACAHDPSNVDAVAVYFGCAVKNNVTGEALPAVRRLQGIDKSKAAKVYDYVAKWTVARDYWTAQKFAKTAHSLDPKHYPNDYVRNKPLFMRDGSGNWIPAQPAGKWESRFGFTDKPAEKPAAGEASDQQPGSDSTAIESIQK